MEPDRDQAQPDQHRADHEGDHHAKDHARYPHLREDQLVEIDGQTQHHERDDLGQAGQRGVEPFDPRLNGARSSPSTIPAMNTARNPEPCASVATP